MINRLHLSHTTQWALRCEIKMSIWCVIINFEQISHLVVLSEAATRGVLWKEVFLEISQNSQENTCTRVSFLIKLQASGLRPATVLKKGLWHRYFPNNSAKFLRTLFHRTPLGYCFSTVDFEHVDSHWGFLLLRYHVSIFIYIICFTLFDVL